MTRLNKINFLQLSGENIKYHFAEYTSQRRLIIDEVEGFKYNSGASDQKLAKEHVDLLYWEITRNS